MKVVVAGAGSVGVAIARDLRRHGHDVLVIEQDTELVTRLKGKDATGIEWIAADACEVSSLHVAGLAQMDVIVAATGDDEDNLVISLLAKQEFAVPRVIARVNNSKNQWLFTESWGVDVAVSTPELYTSLVEEAVSVGSLVHLFGFESGNAHLVEVTLAEDSPADGQAIGDLQLPRDAAVVAVIRRGHLVSPDKETVMASGDEVVVLTTTESEPAIEQLFVAPGTLVEPAALPGDDHITGKVS
jgi:trk/ktr system potassium uptake protein